MAIMTKGGFVNRRMTQPDGSRALTWTRTKEPEGDRATYEMRVGAPSGDQDAPDAEGLW